MKGNALVVDDEGMAEQPEQLSLNEGAILWLVNLCDLSVGAAVVLVVRDS